MKITVNLLGDYYMPGSILRTLKLSLIESSQQSLGSRDSLFWLTNEETELQKKSNLLKAATAN